MNNMHEMSVLANSQILLQLVRAGATSKTENQKRMNTTYQLNYKVCYGSIQICNGVIYDGLFVWLIGMAAFIQRPVQRAIFVSISTAILQPRFFQSRSMTNKNERRGVFFNCW